MRCRVEPQPAQLEGDRGARLTPQARRQLPGKRAGAAARLGRTTPPPAMKCVQVDQARLMVLMRMKSGRGKGSALRTFLTRSLLSVWHVAGLTSAAICPPPPRRRAPRGRVHSKRVRHRAQVLVQSTRARPLLGCVCLACEAAGRCSSSNIWQATRLGGARLGGRGAVRRVLAAGGPRRPLKDSAGAGRSKEAQHRPEALQGCQSR